VDFVLINDFMTTGGFVGEGSVTAPADEGTATTAIVIPVNNQGIKNTYATVGAPSETQFVTTSPSLPTDVTTSTNFVFNFPANLSGVERTNTIPITYKNLDGTTIRVEYFTITQESGRALLTGGGIQLLTNTLNELTA